MLRRMAPVLAVLLLIGVLAGSLVSGAGERYERLDKYTSRPIPQGLPWYYVVVFGDNRPPRTSSVEYSPPFHYILHDINETRPHAVIGTGDHVGRGYKDQMIHLWMLMKDYENVWLGFGNHDRGRDTWFWRQSIAPLYYYVDKIPGWRIVFLNSEDDAYTLAERAEEMLNVTDRAKIVVIHRPLYPWVDHNIDSRKKEMLEQIFIRENVSLVLEGHWHGYAEETRGDIRYVIVGGGGAPLYSWPGHPGYPRNYHYMQLILYPNGTYSYRIIQVADQAGRSVGSFKVESRGDTVYIYNNRLDFWSHPTRVTTRINLSVAGHTVYVVLDADPGVVQARAYVYNGYIYVETNTSGPWYAYLGDGSLARPINSSHACFNCTYTEPVSGGGGEQGLNETTAQEGTEASAANETTRISKPRGAGPDKGYWVSVAAATLSLALVFAALFVLKKK